MDVIDLPLSCLLEASWSPNRMDAPMLARLRESLRRYRLLQPMVVRPQGHRSYEVLSGNQRLRVYREMGLETAPCVIVDLDDSQARLLAQALNHIHGEDDLGLRAEVLRKVLESFHETEVLDLLPETVTSLHALSSLGQESIAEHLHAWQQAQQARLKHLQFQVTGSQLEIVQEALKQAQATSTPDDGSPNKKGRALTAICRAYLELMEEPA